MKRKIVSLLTFLSISIAMFASNDKGVEFYKAGMYEAAKEIFEKQTNASADEQIIAAYYLGLMAADEQNTVAATEQFQKAISLNPKSAFGYIGKGRLELKNNVKAGEAFLKQAEGMGKKNADVLVKVAEAFFVNNQNVKAQALLEKAKVANKSNVDIYLLEAEIILTRGKDSETIGKAISKVEDADYYSPNNPLVLTKLAQLYRMVSGLNFAAEKVNSAIAVNKDYLPAYVELGNVKFAQGRNKEAVEAFEKAIITGTKVPFEWYENYAYALYFDKQYEKSLQEIEKNLLQKPDNATLLRLQAYNMYELGKYEDGLTKMETYFTTVPKDKHIYLDFMTMGRYQTKLKNYEAAIESFNTAISLDTTANEPYKEISTVYGAMGNYEEAVNNYEKALAKKTTVLPSELNVLGETCMNAAGTLFNNSGGDKKTLQANLPLFTTYVEKGVKAFTDFIAIAPDMYLGYYSRATLYSIVDAYEFETTGKHKGVARQYYDEAIEVMLRTNTDGVYNKNIASAYNYHAGYCIQNNETKNAIEYYKKSLEIDPTNKTAKEQLTLLKVKF